MQMVLDHLVAGKDITPIEALERFGVFRLAAIVHSLRKEGFEIATDLIGNGRNKFARYSMSAQ
jgi:hypothetical protein